MSRRPANILIIITDQLSQKALGAYGDTYAQTPNMDRLAACGVRFTNAYTPYPLCAPARASFWTGRLPHATGVVSNGRKWPIVPVPESVATLGAIFNQAGYETVHFGKTHDAGGLRGFRCDEERELPVDSTDYWPVDYDTRNDAWATARAIEHLEAPHEKPFVMVADIQNPHDICNWVGTFAGPHEDVPVPVELPPLPDNFEVTDWEERPLPIQYICCSHNRLSQAAQWNETNYRHYLAAYYHFVNRADSCVGRVLSALETSDAADNTLVVFFSDHGDGMAAHRMVTKQVAFYEELTRVPLILAGPGIEGSGKAIAEPLVSLCDLLPTLAEYAGLQSPGDIYGRSLMPWLRGEAPGGWRDYVVSEWVTEWGFTIEPGRMIRTEGYKYTRYLEGGGEELFDLAADPGETRTLAHEGGYAGVLERHRRILERHIEATGDDFPGLPVKADPRWRAHPPGCTHHRGPAAPMV